MGEQDVADQRRAFSVWRNDLQYYIRSVRKEGRFDTYEAALSDLRECLHYFVVVVVVSEVVLPFSVVVVVVVVVSPSLVLVVVSVLELKEQPARASVAAIPAAMAKRAALFFIIERPFKDIVTITTVGIV